MERLSKNFLWMSAANLIGSLFTIIFFVYVARTLKAESFGYLSYAQTLALYLANFVDLGLTTYGIREVAKNTSRVSDYVSEIVSFKLMVAGIIYILFISAVSISNYSPLMKVLLAESALMLFIPALATEWAFQGVEKMYMVFISFGTTTFLQLLLVFTFVKSPADLLKVPLLYFIGATPIIFTFLKKLHFRLKGIDLDFGRIRLYLSSSLIIWAIAMTVQLYNGLDIIILGFFRNMAEVGCFSIARKAIGGATLLTVFLANAALPRLAHSFWNDKVQFKAAAIKFFKLSAILTVFVFLPIILNARSLIILTVGKGYISATLPLQIMTLGLIMVLFNIPFSTSLIAASFEKEVLKQACFCAFFSIAANLFLIQRYGMTGAATVFLLTEALALAWILTVYNRKIKEEA